MKCNVIIWHNSLHSNIQRTANLFSFAFTKVFQNGRKIRGMEQNDERSKGMTSTIIVSKLSNNTKIIGLKINKTNQQSQHNGHAIAKTIIIIIKTNNNG